MPQVGLGIWKIPNESTADMVYLAIKTGYRTIDSAMDYGNEVELGQGIKRALDEGICERKDLFIVSKLWNSFHAKENVRKAINKVLKDTQLDYLDAFYIHFPIAQKFIPIEEKYPPEPTAETVTRSTLKMSPSSRLTELWRNSLTKG